MFTSISHGLLLAIFLSLYAFGFWYGKKMIIDNLDTHKYNAADILGAFFCFLVGGSSFSQLSPYMKNIAEGRVAIA